MVLDSRLLNDIKVINHINRRKSVKQCHECLTVFIGLPFSIVLERYFRLEVSLLSILCMRMEMGTIRVSGGSDIIT